MDHRGLARLYAYAVALALLLGVLTAAWMRIELASEVVHSSAELYSQVFTSHGLIMAYGIVPLAIPATIGHRMLPELLGRSGLALIAVGFAALLASLLGMAILLAATSLGSSPLLSPGMLLIGLGSAGMAVPLLASCLGSARVRLLDSPLALGLLIVGIGQLLAGGTIMAAALGQLGEGILGVAQTPPPWLEFGGLVLITQAMAGHSPLAGRARAGVALALAALGAVAMIDWLAPYLFGPGAPTGPSSALGLIGLVALVFAWGDLARGRPLPAGPQRVFVGLFVFAFVLRTLLAFYMATISVDTHLEDTYFVFALAHLRTTSALLLALPAGVLWCWPKLALGRPPGAVAWSIAAWLSGLAVPSFALVAARLGHRGMPRRYVAYLPEYWPMQFTLSILGAVLAIGVLAWTIDLARAAWARPAPE